ncbi:unnamed protein product [Meloidogyne enterolobii]|uniref:Uncharacterized protein n=1 Tax=Meloidogyne enterolobii TaxID=390850 RepID=A0ACB0XT31_MELEN
MTIPRLELMGAVAGKRMIEFIRKECDIEIIHCYIWSDSTCVLSWILNSNEEKLPKFVKRRITELRENKSINWKYVPTEHNPSDLATRGCLCEELKSHKIWWEGPSFLRKNESEWPVLTNLVLKDKKENLNTINIDLLVGEIIDMEVRNEYPKLVNISIKICLALKKFIKKVKINTEYLKDLKNSKTNVGIRKMAEYLVIMQSQFKHPPGEKEINELVMKKEKYGIWTCAGRLENTSMKNPIFISYNSFLANLLCNEAHLKTFHSGVRQSLTELRINFWIPSARKKMRNIIDKCFECRKLKLEPFKIPEMPSLPKERVTRSKPFENCGVDYAGPFEVKNNEGKISKCWIEIFTCMSTRFTHLEIVRDLTAKSCIMAFRRFLAEYGLPRKIISDNGTQYQLTSKVVNEITKKLELKNISWVFIPSLSPWFGGFYEAIVKIMKRCLKSAIGKKLLYFEELRTILPEIKLIMNTRPLTYIYENFEDTLDILRPIDLIMPQRNENKFDFGTIDEEDFKLKETQKDELINDWKRANEMLNNFWAKWQTEYLSQLRERIDKHSQKRAKRNYFPNINEIVLIQDKNVPKNYWQMAKIVELIKSKDGLIRSAKIKSKGKTLTRAIALLYPLELYADHTIEEENKNLKETSKNENKGNKDKNEKNKEGGETEKHKMQLRKRVNKINYKETESESEDEVNIMYYTDSEIESSSDEEDREVAVILRQPIPVNRGLFAFRPINREINSRLIEDPIDAKIKREPIINNRFREKIPLMSACFCDCQEGNEGCICINRTYPCSCYPIPNDPFNEIEWKKFEIRNNSLKYNPFRESIKEFNNQTNKKSLIKKCSKDILKIILNKLTSKTIILILLLIYLSKITVVANPCTKNEKLKFVEMHECVHDGLVIKRDNQGLLCWEYIDCKEKHLRIQKEMYNNYCGEKCSCPSWTNQCSFYYGPSVKNSTLKNKSVYEILNSQEVKAKLCKIESGDNCAKLRTIKEFNQIELYDGNKILVNDLNIIIEDLMENEYVCVGQGPVTGSAKFCENHHCNERGTQLCYYVRSEIAFLETSKEKIPIKAWGRVKIKTNEFLDKKENLICKKCELKCTKDGIEIKNEGKLNGIEICKWREAKRNRNSV